MIQLCKIQTPNPRLQQKFKFLTYIISILLANWVYSPQPDFVFQFRENVPAIIFDLHQMLSYSLVIIRVQSHKFCLALCTAWRMESQYCRHKLRRGLLLIYVIKLR